MPYLLIDRDGVINEDSDAYIKSPSEWVAIPGSAAAIARLEDMGYTVLVITNQSGVGRGYFSKDTLDAIHAKMHSVLADSGARLGGVYICPHAPDAACGCRKPLTGLIEEARRDHPDLGNPWFVGDSLRDLQCARDSGCRPALVLTGKGRKTLDKGFSNERGLAGIPVAEDLAAFVDRLASGELPN